MIDDLLFNDTDAATEIALKFHTSNSPGNATNISTTASNFFNMTTGESVLWWIWADYFDPQNGQRISLDFDATASNHS